MVTSVHNASLYTYGFIITLRLTLSLHLPFPSPFPTWPTQVAKNLPHNGSQKGGCQFLLHMPSVTNGYGAKQTPIETKK